MSAVNLDINQQSMSPLLFPLSAGGAAIPNRVFQLECRMFASIEKVTVSLDGMDLLVDDVDIAQRFR